MSDTPLSTSDQSGDQPGSLARFLRDGQVRAVLAQLFVVGVVVLLGWIGISNVLDNLARQNIASGFGFLNENAGFGVNQTLVDYDAGSTYGQAFWVGLTNTLLVAAIGIVLTTFLGFAIGVGRLSSNWLVAKLCATYVETLRNIPLLLQIFFWYFGVLKALPHPRDSITMGEGFLINIRGLYFPRPEGAEGMGLVLLAFIAGIIIAVLLSRAATRHMVKTGQTRKVWPIGVGLIVVVPAALFFILGQPLGFDMPQASRFNVKGGVRIIPELIALVLALTTYTASFIAEIVRAGILAVPKGQSEAAAALGLPNGLTLRKIIIPQAMRVIIPPLTSQYLNLTKNSSLAVAIAYPDLVSVFAGTTLNQTGQAVEILGLTMTVYLLLSLSTAAFMNWFNSRMAIRGRS